jgi:hypothetical protein
MNQIQPYTFEQIQHQVYVQLKQAGPMAPQIEKEKNISVQIDQMMKKKSQNQS